MTNIAASLVGDPEAENEQEAELENEADQENEAEDKPSSCRRTGL